MINKIQDLKLAVIGLGYVGLPLVLEFAKKKIVIGFDINNQRVKELNSGIDINQEFKKKELKSVKKVIYTNKSEDLKYANCYIITVPTPVDKFKKPDLKALTKASKMVSKFIKKNDLIIYESTVYPGCTEEVCVPLLEKFSKLKFNRDFFCGYSPERINPGDKINTVSNIKKITSGSTHKIADLVDKLYKTIITAGTYKAPSIKVAEAAKVIENTQRDINIALINEFSILFNKLNIDTQSVLNAAGTKWNFLPFKPGLVGGHCIGVDPYYLTHKAKSIGYKTKIILAGRSLNDNMGDYVALQLINQMKKKNIRIKRAKILIMGLTFKENCADIRNSGVENIVNYLKKVGCKLDLLDPYARREEVKKKYGIYPNLDIKRSNKFDAILIAVAHNHFKKIGLLNIKKLCKKSHVIFDVKNLFNSNQVDLKL